VGVSANSNQNPQTNKLPRKSGNATKPGVEIRVMNTICFTHFCKLHIPDDLWIELIKEYTRPLEALRYGATLDVSPAIGQSCSTIKGCCV
jgi:hypothetical protein